MTTIINWMKKATLAILSTGTTLFIAACYGTQYIDMPRDMVEGTVTDDGNGVGGLQLCVVFSGDVTLDGSACDSTSSDGYYYISGDRDLYDRAYNEGCTLALRDVDGPANGSYDNQAVNIPGGALPMIQDFELGDGIPGDDDDTAGDDDDTAGDDDDTAGDDDDTAGDDDDTAGDDDDSAAGDDDDSAAGDDDDSATP